METVSTITKEILPYIIASLFGALIHIIWIFSTQEKKIKDFSAGMWLKKNKWSTSFSILASIALVYILDSMSQLNCTTAIVAGFSSDASFKSLMNKNLKDNNIKSETEDEPARS